MGEEERLSYPLPILWRHERGKSQLWFLLYFLGKLRFIFFVSNFSLFLIYEYDSSTILWTLPWKLTFNSVHFFLPVLSPTPFQPSILTDLDYLIFISIIHSDESIFLKPKSEYDHFFQVLNGFCPFVKYKITMIIYRVRHCLVLISLTFSGAIFPFLT